MRIRLAELMAEHGIENAHALAKASGLKITTAYRLVENGGKLDKRLSGLLEALCTAFAVEPCELLERDTPPAARKKRAPRGKRTGTTGP
jgi:DNA-binding Xre family transcriptional regulator